MSFGVKAKDLLLELKRSEWLPPYNEDAVRGVLAEGNALWDELVITLGNKPANGGERIPAPIKANVIVHKHALYRNKRCLLAYLKYRLDKVAQLRWEAGPVIPPHLQQNLSGREVEFFNGYSRLLTDYMSGFDLDLTADLSPPKELKVEVRALEDCGEIMTDQGPVNLGVGTTHLLRRSDVEHLIRQGLLEQVENETSG